MSVESTNSITNNVTFDIGENEVTIQPNELPTISPSTLGIFKELGVQSPEALNYPLKGKIETLSTSIQKLEAVKSSSIKDKIFGLVRSALYTTLVTASILGTIATATVSAAGAVGVGLASYLVCCGLAMYYLARLGINPISHSSPNYLAPVWSVMVAPFLPIYEEFWKISRCAKDVSTQKQEIEATLGEISTFFAQDLSHIRNLITTQIRNSQTSLEQVQKLPIPTPAGQRELSEKKAQYEQVSEEFEKATTYYAELAQ